MVELYLIRHGKTYGNTLGRYIGTTDEALCPEGIAGLKTVHYPEVEAVFASPMKRCVETAELLFLGMRVQCFGKLRECDFGAFENKNYRELEDHPAYQAWVDSGGTLAFPGGESPEAFRKRCREGFLEVLAVIRKKQYKRAALVVHGGTIMSILEAYAVPRKGFYDWQVKNGAGYRACWNERSEGDVELFKVEPVGADRGLCSGSNLR